MKTLPCRTVNEQNRKRTGTDHRSWSIPGTNAWMSGMTPGTAWLIDMRNQKNAGGQQIHDNKRLHRMCGRRA